MYPVVLEVGVVVVVVVVRLVVLLVGRVKGFSGTWREGSAVYVSEPFSLPVFRAIHLLFVQHLSMNFILKP